VKPDSRFCQTITAIKMGIFGDPATFHQLTASLEEGNDYYILGLDFASCEYIPFSSILEAEC